METNDVPLRILPSPRLPQETLDAVVDSVEDKDTLKNLALSSSILLTAARRRLFSSWTFETYTMPDLGTWINRSAWASHVKCLCLLGRNKPPVEGSSFQLSRDILAHFTRVEDICLWGYPALDQLWSLSGIALSSPIALFPSVKTLTLDTVRVSVFSAFARIIASCPSVVDLSLRDVKWADNDSDLPEFEAFMKSTPRLRIQALCVWKCHAGPLNSFLFPPEVDVQLRKVAIHDGFTSVAEDWNPILERAGQHLHQGAFCHTGSAGTIAVGLHENTNLRSLSLDICHLPTYVHWLHNTLSSVRSKIMDKIACRIVETESMLADAGDLSEIDRILSGKQFESLPMANFCITVFIPPSYSDKDREACRERAKAVALSRLPELHRQGRLVVDAELAESQPIIRDD